MTSSMKCSRRRTSVHFRSLAGHFRSQAGDADWQPRSCPEAVTRENELSSRVISRISAGIGPGFLQGSRGRERGRGRHRHRHRQSRPGRPAASQPCRAPSGFILVVWAFVLLSQEMKVRTSNLDSSSKREFHFDPCDTASVPESARGLQVRRAVG